jgi:hypothetical protein
MFTPLELLNLYLTGGKSKENTSSELYQKFNRELTLGCTKSQDSRPDNHIKGCRQRSVIK